MNITNHNIKLRLSMIFEKLMRLTGLVYLLRAAGVFYIRKVCLKEYANQLPINERPVEFAFLFRNLAEIYPEKILDVGTGMTALPHLLRNCGFHTTAIDNIKDYWASGMFNRHYHVINNDISNTTMIGSYDFITCISVLEHIKEHRAAIKSICSLLVPGGHLLITFPYNEHEYHHNVYEHHDSHELGTKVSYFTQAFSRSEINQWLSESPLTVIKQEYWQFFDGEFWTCGNLILPPRNVDADSRHQISCLLLQKVII